MPSTGAVPQWLARPLALGGMLFFVYALLFAAYRYVVVFARPVVGPVSTGAIVADVVLFSIFALHHSLFARDRVRNLVTRSVGSLERSFYVWIASLLFVAVCAAWRPAAGLVWRTTNAWIAWPLAAGQLVGVWLALRSAMVIDFRELSGFKQVDTSAPALSDPSRFTTNGPYGWVRHPIYTGWFLMVFSVPTMTMTRFVFAMTSTVYLLIAIPLEERSLRRSSNGAYDRYVRQVPWKLVPRVF